MPGLIDDCIPHQQHLKKRLSISGNFEAIGEKYFHLFVLLLQGKEKNERKKSSGNIETMQIAKHIF